MTSLNIEQPSSTCVNLKEANEIPVNVSTTEHNYCANLESMPCINNPEPQAGENMPHLVPGYQNQDTKTYECKECHKNFTTIPYLEKHMKSHTKLLVCWICDETFSSMTQLTLHLTNCSKQQISMHCTTCDKTFEFPALFKQHKLIYHPEGRPREAFPKNQVLVQNMQQYFGKYSCESSEIFKSKGQCCPICQKKFSNSYYALRGHALLHEVSNFFCVICHKKFTTSKIDFQIHMQQHIPKNQPPFKCEHCFKEYGKRNRLWSHYRVVHPFKRVNVTTETDSSTAKVKKTVAENNILSDSDTPLCNKEISKLIMEAHAKRFTCPECQKACQSKYALLEHLQLHEIRNFICVVCHKEFTTTKIDFKIHMQQHCTPDNRGLFNCEHCPRSYSHKRGLIGHYRVKHPPKKVVNEKEFSENSERTQQIALVKSEPSESDSTITHNKIIINKMAEDKEDKNLLELEKAAHNEKFCEENELTELVFSVKSVPSSPESSYVNLEDDKITVEETNVNTEAITHNEIIMEEDNYLMELEKSASDKEFCEENELTELVSSMKTEPSSPESSYVKLEDDKFIIEETDVKTDAITHNEIIIKKDNNLIELEKSASDKELCEENEITEFVSSMKSVQSSPESLYVNLEDDNITVEETDVNTEAITHEIIIKEDYNLIDLEKSASDDELCEENELTELVSSMKTEPSSPESSYVKLEGDKFMIEETDVKTDAITYNEIIIKEENNLIELENSAGYKKFCKENELTKLVSSMKSVPSYPETPYINLGDNKFIIEETNVKTDESKAELNNPLPALTGSCPVCHEIYMNASYLHQHFMKKHSHLLCWICGERFLNVDQLASHIETHVRMYACKLCDKSFIHQSDFETHHNTTHRSQNRLQCNNKLFSCKICGKRFITERHLENHLKTHTEDELKCVPKQVVAIETESSIGTFSGRKFRRRHRLFSCKICGKRFITERHCEDHLKTHTEDDSTYVSKQVVANETKSSIGTVTRRKVKGRIKKKTVKKHKDVTLSDSLDLNVPVNDKDSEPSELTKLKDSLKSYSSSHNTRPYSLKTWKSSWRNNSQSAPSGLLILPESNPIDQNVPKFPKNDKKSEKPELKELVTRKNDSAAKRKPFSSESCMSSQNTHSLSSSDGNFLLQPSQVHSFTQLDIAKNAVFNGKLVKVKTAVIKQKNPSITNHKLDNKRPFKCKHCPKNFTLKTSLTRHCITDHVPKRGVTNEADVVTGKRFLVKLKMLKKSKPQKQHASESNTENRGDTVSYMGFCEQSELNEIVDAELVDTVKYEPSSPKLPCYVNSELEEPVDTAKYEPSSSESPYYYVKNELEELVNTAKFEKNDAAQSPYYYVITKSKELVDTAIFELSMSSPKSPYYGNLEEKNTIDENEENTEELKPEILDGPSTSNLDSG